MGIEIRLLGRFLALRDGEEIPASAFRQRLVRTLVRVLLSRRGEFVSRDVLTEALWPRRMPADPAANLRVLVTLARQALGDPSLLTTGPGGYAFSEDHRCMVDAEMFLARAADAREALGAGDPREALRGFRSALQMWRGEPLPEDAYENWAHDYRRRLLGEHVQALEGAAAAALALHMPGQALAWAEEAVGHDALRESSQLLLVEALAASGDTAGALAAYDAFRDRFVEELGLDPSPEGAELQARILRGELPGAHTRRPLPVQPPGPDLPFVDRQEELEAILSRLQLGAPIVAAVTGASGSGKSRLLAEVAARCQIPVVAVRAFLPDQQDAWALTRSVLRETLALDLEAARAIPDRIAQALADILPDLEELRPIAKGPMDPESRRALALEGSVRLLASVASEGALLLVDDLQWADATSLTLLGLLARRIPLLDLVFAYRQEEVDPTAPMATFMEELPRLGWEIHTVHLGPLPTEAISEVFGDEELVRAVEEETDRSPMVIADVINDLVSKGAIELDPKGRWCARTGDAGTLARTAARSGRRRVMQARIRQLPERRRHTLSLLALLGREAPARLLSEAGDADQGRVLEDLETLARAGLVRLGEGGWATAYELIGETVVESLDPAERGRLHGTLVAALGSPGGDPAEVARHLIGVGDTEAAAEAFAVAARISLERFASDEAERLAQAGLDLEPHPRVRSDLLDVRGEARARRGNLQGARDDLRFVLQTTTPGPERSRVLARMAMVVSAAEDFAHGADLIEAALTEAGEDPRARAEALSVGAILDVNTNRLERAGARTAEARQLFEKIGDAEGVARTVDAQAMAILGHGNITEAVDMLDQVARLFLDSGMLLRVGTTRAYRAFALVWMERPQEALDEVEEALKLERMLGHHDVVLCIGVKALALAALGRVEEAKGPAAEGLTMSRQLGHRGFTAVALLILGTVARAAGEAERAEAFFRESLEEGKGMPVYASWAAAQLARCLIERGDLAQAEHYTAEALHKAGLPLTHYELRLAQAELAVARRDPDALLIATEALTLAEVGGHTSSATRLRQLVAKSNGGNPGDGAAP